MFLEQIQSCGPRRSVSWKVYEPKLNLVLWVSSAIFCMHRSIVLVAFAFRTARNNALLQAVEERQITVEITVYQSTATHQVPI